MSHILSHRFAESIEKLDSGEISLQPMTLREHYAKA